MSDVTNSVQDTPKVEPQPTSVNNSQVTTTRSKKPLIIVAIILLVLCLCLSFFGVLLGSVLPRMGIPTFLNPNVNVPNAPQGPEKNNNDTRPEDSGDRNPENPNDNSNDVQDDPYSDIQYGELPSDFPRDIPIYSNNSELTSATVDGKTSVLYLADATSDTLYDFFLQELDDQNWTVSEKNMFGTLFSIKASKGNKVIELVAIQGEDNQTVVTMTVEY